LLKSKEISKLSTPLVPFYGLTTKVSILTPTLSRVEDPEEASTTEVTMS